MEQSRPQVALTITDSPPRRPTQRRRVEPISDISDTEIEIIHPPSYAQRSQRRPYDTYRIAQRSFSQMIEYDHDYVRGIHLQPCDSQSPPSVAESVKEFLHHLYRLCGSRTSTEGSLCAIEPSIQSGFPFRNLLDEDRDRVVLCILFVIFSLKDF